MTPHMGRNNPVLCSKIILNNPTMSIMVVFYGGKNPRTRPMNLHSARACVQAIARRIGVVLCKSPDRGTPREW